MAIDTFAVYYVVGPEGLCLLLQVYGKIPRPARKIPSATKIGTGNRYRESDGRRNIDNKKEKDCIWFAPYGIKNYKDFFCFLLTPKYGYTESNRANGRGHTIFCQLMARMYSENFPKMSIIPLKFRTPANETEFGTEECEKSKGYRGELGIPGEY